MSLSWFVAHAQGKAGVEQQWWVCSDEAKAMLRQMGAEIWLTADIGRPYKCVVKHRGYWTMQDMLAFTEFIAPLLFRNQDILHHDVSRCPRDVHCTCMSIELQPFLPRGWPCTQMAQAWNHLRSAVLHYMRAQHQTEGERLFTERARKDAAAHLRAYANLLQSKVGDVDVTDASRHPVGFAIILGGLFLAGPACVHVHFQSAHGHLPPVPARDSQRRCRERPGAVG